MTPEEIEELRGAWNTNPHTLPEADLIALTAGLPEHPEWWDGPCMCATCRSYCDDDGNGDQP